MMRIRLLLLLAVCGCAPKHSGDAAVPVEIFRYATIGRSLPLDSLVLGQRWSSAAKYGAGDADTLFALPFGTFGGADAIAVSRDARGLVSAITFAYHMRRDVRSLLDEYRTSLGAPVDVRVDTLERALRTTTRWQDAVTEFTFIILSPPGADGVGAMAILADRRLSSQRPGPDGR